jgi:hypothetical protein
MYPEKKPWSEKLVLVCTKCGDSILKKAAENLAVSTSGNLLQTLNPADEMRMKLKKELQAAGLWGKTRVVGSTCLDLCPENEVAVVICTEKKRELFRADPQKDFEKLLNHIQT